MAGTDKKVAKKAEDAKAKALKPAKTQATKAKSTPKKAAKADGGKKKKDPNAPKRPASAYLLFANDHREEIKKANASATFGELGKLIGEAWKSVSDSTKAKYEKKAGEAKAKYDAEMAAYKGK